jgi:hypothetical protein
MAPYFCSPNYGTLVSVGYESPLFRTPLYKSVHRQPGVPAHDSTWVQLFIDSWREPQQCRGHPWYSVSCWQLLTKP